MEGLVIVPALCLGGFQAAAQQQGSSQQQTGDPVADAARKARETKKDAPKAKKIYTDDDVKKSTPEQAAPTPAPDDVSGTTAAKTPQAAGDAAKSQDAAKTEDPNGEADWRKRFQAQRGKIAKAERELDILGRELEKAQGEHYPDPTQDLTEQNNRGHTNAQTATRA